MAVAKKLFNPTQVGTTVETLYTVPAGVETMVKRLVAYNSDSTDARVIEIHLVTAGSSAGAGNQLVKESVDPEDYAILDVEQVLEAGDMIQAVASVATTVTVHGSGIEEVN